MTVSMRFQVLEFAWHPSRTEENKLRVHFLKHT
uniref:Uncharacterized protein n=1 Tax=Lepeophtheirus salmonis TaxID=72036 RepID=A0A0K2UD30_LEPSM